MPSQEEECQGSCQGSAGMQPHLLARCTISPHSAARTTCLYHPLEKQPSPVEHPLPQKSKSQASRAEKSYGGIWGRFLLTQKRWEGKMTWRRHNKVTTGKEENQDYRSEWQDVQWYGWFWSSEKRSSFLAIGRYPPRAVMRMQHDLF